MIVTGIITVIALLALPVISRARTASRSVACVSNLRHLATAFSMYGQSNGDQLPYPAFTEIPWERSLSDYASADAFVCPADEELAPATGSSYDWRDTGIPETTLAGHNLHEANRPDVVLAFDALPSWHKKGRMNAAFTDGSVRDMDAQECVADVNRPIRP